MAVPTCAIRLREFPREPRLSRPQAFFVVDKKVGRYGSKYHVKEKNHAFLKLGSIFYRSNEIWQYRFRKKFDKVEEEKLMTRNLAVVRYQPAEFIDLTERKNEEKS